MLIEFLNHAAVMLCQARTTKADAMHYFFGNNVHVHIIWNSNSISGDSSEQLHCGNVVSMPYFT